MSYKIIVRPAGEADILDAVAWYDLHADALSHSLLNEFDLTLKRIEAGPLRFPIALGDARRALVRRFPYSIYFRLREDEILVIAVIHQHRDPRSWKPWLS